MSKKNLANRGPIELKYREQMNGLARGIDDIINGENCKPEERQAGFVLIMFDVNETSPKDGRFNYISNSERADVIATMKEVIARYEGRYHDESEKKN